MKVQPTISKISNLYFFISNLSEWHQSFRPKYNEFWLREKPLSDQEKKLLTRFAEIHRDYGFDNKNFYLGRIFFLSEDPWKELDEKTAYSEEVKNIFQEFEGRFKQIWRESEKVLISQKKIITDYFKNESETNQSISDELLSFYSLDTPKCQDVKVIMLLSVPNMTGGGANLKPYGVTLECSGWTGDDRKILSVLYHEMIHLCYENYEQLSESARESIDSRTREKIIAAMFPNGYLAHKYFH